jgi:hypothetical protein
MVSFQTKNPNLGKFWRSLDWKMLIYFMAMWNIYRHLGYFTGIWDILWPFGTFFSVLVYCVNKNLVPYSSVAQRLHLRGLSAAQPQSSDTLSAAEFEPAAVDFSGRSDLETRDPEFRQRKWRVGVRCVCFVILVQEPILRSWATTPALQKLSMPRLAPILRL